MVVGQLLRFTSKNVFTNLAGEERLFERVLDRSLLFYVNSESVVLGRTQNPYNEVDVAYAAANGIPIARRRSGGGTVVHDEGNLNFCFIRPREEHEPLSNAKLVASVLKEEYGIKATVNERADILVDGMKVSGAAYRISKNKAYHHGTLLINSNLGRLRRLLKSPLSKGMEAMGTSSIPSPVTNLADHYSGEINTDLIVDAIAERFSRKNAYAVPLSPANVERTFGGLQSERGELCSHSWVYGKTPRFTYEFTSNGMLLKFGVAKGMLVSDVRVRAADGSDGAEKEHELRSDMAQCLIGRPFDGKLLARHLRVGSPGNRQKANRDLLEGVASALETDIPVQYWKEDAYHPNEAAN